MTDRDSKKSWASRQHAARPGRMLRSTSDQAEPDMSGLLADAQAEARLARMEDSLTHAIDLARRMPSDVKR